MPVRFGTAGGAGRPAQRVYGRRAYPVRRAGRFCYELAEKRVRLASGEKKTMAMYSGVGLEESVGRGFGKRLVLHGWERMLGQLERGSIKHTIGCEDSFAKRLMNANSFYCYFFSQAITLDTEQLILTSARSLRVQPVMRSVSRSRCDEVDSAGSSPDKLGTGPQALDLRVYGTTS